MRACDECQRFLTMVYCNVHAVLRLRFVVLHAICSTFLVASFPGREIRTCPTGLLVLRNVRELAYH